MLYLTERSNFAWKLVAIYPEFKFLWIAWEDETIRQSKHDSHEKREEKISKLAFLARSREWIVDVQVQKQFRKPRLCPCEENKDRNLAD